MQYDPTTFQSRGLVTAAVFDRNATGNLAPFNGMLVVGTHEEDPNTQTVTIRLWEWETGLTLPPVVNITTPTQQTPPSSMNTTTR